MSFEKTTIIDNDTIVKKEIKEELISIFNDLEEVGYDASKQIVGYLVSGDPGYISSNKDARNRILKYNREDIMELILVDFINKK